MLHVEALEVRYGDTVALDGVDLVVEDGAVVSVLGPSGSGKSTLLRAVAGLEPPVRGRVAWDGDDLTRVPPHRRQLGLMFQDHTLFPHRDVLGNVAFGLRMLDEPLGSLDRALRERLMVELRELFTRLGLTSLYVTHDHDEAFALADRVAVMHAGRIEQLGSPVDVWEHPANEFVARFLGYNVTDALGHGRVAVRPDSLRIEPDGPIAGVVTARTFRRDHFLLEVKIADGPSLEVAVTGDRIPTAGDPVRLAVDPDAVVPLPP